MINKLKAATGVIILLVTLVPSPLGASSFYESNNILFYNKDATDAIVCSSSNIGPIPGDDNLVKIYNYFLGKGTSQKVAAAIVGNIYQESKGDPLLIQGGKRTNDPSTVGLYSNGSMFENKPGQSSVGKAWGILQWDPGNAALYWQKQAGVSGDISQLETQLEIAWWHLNNLAPTSKKNILREMEAASSVDEATDIMVRRFFGAGKPMLANRQAAAAKALSYPVDPSMQQAIGESSGLSCGNEGSSSGGSSLSEGGLTEEQAKQFVINYGTNKNNSTKNAMRDSSWKSCGGGSKGGGSNCVSFSEFFLNKFTDTKAPNPMGNGHQVVGNLAAKGLPTGTEPRVGAIFSIADGGWGHTGVVLGIHGDTIIVGHASCSRGNNGKRGAGDGTSRGSGSAFILSGKSNSGSAIWWGSGSENIRFAYPEVNTTAIESYLAKGE